jgi:thiol:disulfide interchange protein
MSRSLRWSEQWFRRALWLVAIVFAGFLIGLGGLVVGDLPRVETQLSIDDFIDRARAEQARTAIKAAERQQQDVQQALEQAQQRLAVARSDNAAARETFNNWLATRRATQLAEQDPELIRRTQELDALKGKERSAQQEVEKLEQQALQLRQGMAQQQRALHDMEEAARDVYTKELRSRELRVFGYRLALTLPLLLIAGWLFAKKRKSTYWPFVWGFIFFALFAFFVELVPYLPSYGGYVRYIVGIVVTALVGVYAIRALQRYLERQKAQEQLPDEKRREELSYDLALARLAKGVCPGCERAVDLKNAENNYCTHCGICLFDICGSCKARKSAFSRYCHSCGAAADRAA